MSEAVGFKLFLRNNRQKYRNRRLGDYFEYGRNSLLPPANEVWGKFCWWKYMITVARQREGVYNKFMTFINGPGWEPGKKRLGLEEDIPIIDPDRERKNKYNKTVALWCHVYLYTHFALALAAHQMVLQYKNEMTLWEAMLAILYVLWTLTNISYVYEHKWYAAPLELLRCAIYLLADTYICGSSSCPQLFFITRAIYIVSAAIWAIQCTRALPTKDTKTE